MGVEPNASPNVLLVILDSVRARNTSLHGHHNETTPFLETLSGEATVFEQARAPGTWSLPSHASLFTGFHVAEHGLAGPTDVLEPGHTVFEDLQEAGYDTGVFSENPFLTVSDAGLDRGFDVVEGPRNVPFRDALDPTEFVQREGQGQFRAYLQACLDHDRPVRSLANGALVKLAWDYPQLLPDRFSPATGADVYVDLFLDWAGDVDGPWAACVNLMDAHLPYQPSPDHDRWGDDTLHQLQDAMADQVWEFPGGQRPWWQREALEALYDGAIRRCDAELERIVETLRDRGRLDETLVVVTADHGEGFGERSLVRPDQRCVGHGNGGLMQELLHVPLVVRHPAIEAGDVVEAPATLTAFPAAVESFVSGEPDPSATPFVPDGPVVAATDGIDPDTQERAREFLDDIDVLTAPADAVYTGTDGGVEKAVRWGDREALVAVRDARARWRVDDAADVDGVIEEFEDRGVRAEADDVDDAVQERLEDLGYA